MTPMYLASGCFAALEMAESLLDCELGAAAYETGAGDGSREECCP